MWRAGHRCYWILAALVGSAQGACAGEWTVAPEPPQYTYDALGGVEVTGRSWSTYLGTTTAFSTDIRADGFKLRGMTGIGAYKYTSPRWDGRHRTPVAFSGEHASADVFLGYQHTFGPWIVKAFAGVTQQWHRIAPFDIENPVQGGKLGYKGALETWLRLGETAFVQTDLHWAQTFQTYSARMRGGYRLNPAWSVGLETGAAGNATYDSGRLGGFARIDLSFGEASISVGGVSDRSGTTGPYGSFALLFRF